MRRSREEAAETRQRAVDTASKLYRERGLDAVSVSDVMSEIGMTVGGFYRHFESKDALMIEAITRAFDTKQQAHENRKTLGQADTISDMFARYLSADHRDAPATGCPIPPMLSSVNRHSRDVRRIFTEAVQRYVAAIEKLSPGTPRDAHIAAIASMFGALSLARAVDDPELSDRFLEQTLNYWLRTVSEPVPSSGDEQHSKRTRGGA